MQRDLEIDLLRAFVAVSTHRNFTQAGNAIGRTQSAVSLQIKRLEDIIGKKLFERDRQSVAITHIGESLLVYANRIIAVNDAALSHIQRPEAEGLVRIGTPDDYATYLLPSILSSISSEHPRIQIEVICDNGCDLLQLLEQGQLDVVVATHPINKVAGQVARYERVHWVGSKNFIDDPDEPLSLVLFPQGCVCRDIALNALNEIDRDWNVAYSTRSIGLMEQAMSQNSGVSVMEASIVPDNLEIIDSKGGLPPLPNVAISVHKSSNALPHVSIVADILLSRLSKTGRIEN